MLRIHLQIIRIMRRMQKLSYPGRTGSMRKLPEKPDNRKERPMDITIIAAFIAAMGIPSAITGFCFWLLQRKIQKRDDEEKKEREARQKKMDQRESAREKNEIYMIKSIGAAIALAEATAKAVQRIPDAKCNGDMHQALEYAQQVKHEQKDFLNEQALKNLY